MRFFRSPPGRVPHGQATPSEDTRADLTLQLKPGNRQPARLARFYLSFPSRRSKREEGQGKAPLPKPLVVGWSWPIVKGSGR